MVHILQGPNLGPNPGVIFEPKIAIFGIFGTLRF